MILAELARLASGEGLLEDPHYQPIPVKYIVVLGRSGDCLGVVSTVESVTDGNRARQKAKSFQVPRRVTRSSGDRSDFFVDKADYVFGVGDKEPLRMRNRLDLFFAYVESTAKATGDVGAMAVQRFLEGIRSGAIPPPIPADHEPSDLFAFRLSEDENLVSSRPKVRDYWANLRMKPKAGTKASRCLVCGNETEPVDNHPKVRGVPGGNSAGTSLVSFNATAFESYGLSRSENAPCCQSCADGYTTGLNRLLAESYAGPGGPLKGQRYRISSDTVAVFWSASRGIDDMFADLLDGNPEAVNALLGSPWKGHAVDLSDESRFFLAILSGAQGRAILRDWFESTIRVIAGNLRTYFEQVAIVKRYPDDPDVVPLRLILKSLSVRHDDAKLPPNLGGALFESALLGYPFSNSLLERALARVRAEADISGKKENKDPDFGRHRLALIKAILIRNHKKELKPDMDPQNTDVGYRLGRLFAVLERLQGAAINNANATIVDRYYGAASTTPVRVFGRLLGMAQHHASKAEAGGYFQKLMEEILEPLDPANAFPSTLDMTQQGLFALGYYHQRAALWKKKDPSPEPTPLDGGTK